jgi:O-antigen/teichoic acid export membrane protein
LKALVQNRLSQNTLVLLVSNGGSAILSFLLSVLIARAVGANGLGVYAAALAWIFPLSLITEFGLGTLITRDIAQFPEKTDTYIRIAVIVRLLIGGGLMLLLWLIAPLLTDDIAVIQGLRVSAPMIVLVPLYGTFTAVFRARQVMKPIAILNLGMLIAQVLLTAIVFHAGLGVQAALIVNVLTSGGQVGVAWWIYRRNFVGKALSRSDIAIIKLLKQAFPFAIAAILGAMQLRLNFILLEQFAGANTVGQYAAASRFVEAGLLIPAALFGALFPALSALKNEPFRLNQLLRRIQFGLALYGLGFGTTVALLAATIIQWTYGTGFALSVLILQILAWTLLPNVLKSSLILYWYARGYENRVNIVTGIVLVVQFVLSLWLIRIYGVIGAAVTIVITESAALVLLWGMRLVSPKEG